MKEKCGFCIFVAKSPAQNINNIDTDRGTFRLTQPIDKTYYIQNSQFSLRELRISITLLSVHYLLIKHFILFNLKSTIFLFSDYEKHSIVHLKKFEILS